MSQGICKWNLFVAKMVVRAGNLLKSRWLGRLLQTSHYQTDHLRPIPRVLLAPLYSCLIEMYPVLSVSWAADPSSLFRTFVPATSKPGTLGFMPGLQMRRPTLLTDHAWPDASMCIPVLTYKQAHLPPWEWCHQSIYFLSTGGPWVPLRDSFWGLYLHIRCFPPQAYVCILPWCFKRTQAILKAT